MGKRNNGVIPMVDRWSFNVSTASERYAALSGLTAPSHQCIDNHIECEVFKVVRKGGQRPNVSLQKNALTEVLLRSNATAYVSS
jgi:hypothetical protein